MGLFGNENKSQVKKLSKIADKIVALEDKYKGTGECFTFFLLFLICFIFF